MNDKPYPKNLDSLPELPEGAAYRILDQFGFQDCDRSHRNIQNLAGESPLREPFSEIIEHVLNTFADSADPDAALNNFDRFASEIPNRLWLYRLLKDAPFLLRILAACFGSSTYLSDILARNPEHFNELIDAGVMNAPKNRKIMYSELAQSVAPFRSLDQKLSVIRQYKRKESLRIGVRDLLNDASLETTTLELTNLAEATLQMCYEIGVMELVPRFGSPLAEDNRTVSKFAIIGMGKFGGYELNFSSDIDVMFVYSDEGITDKGNENSEYFGKLCEFIINAMSEVTPSGYVFRVDVRLRPESSAGTIARSIEGYEAYYEGWGEIWERQALIKARPVAGDLELGKQFIQTIQPFVYQRYLDGLSISEIKMDIWHTKARIERRIIAENENPQTHVKLGIGGIRDIEFVVQCLQLIHGGPIAVLRNRNSLETLKLLYEHELLSLEDCRTLSEAYRFLRTVEHRIQIEGDQQRYSLPSKQADLKKIARSTGYRDRDGESDLEAFQKDYKRHTRTVRAVYDKVFAESETEEEIDVSLLLSTKDFGKIKQILEPFGFENPREVQWRLKLMAEGPEGSRFSPGVRTKLIEIAPTLLNYIRHTPDPDMALSHIEAFTSRIGARASYYTMFKQNPPILDMLARLCGTSLFLSELLIAHPESFDVMTAPAVMEKPRTLAEKLDSALQIIGNAPEVHVFNVLRQFKNSENLRIGLRNILKRADLWTTTAELSDLAEAILRSIYPHLSEHFKQQYGVPLTGDGAEATFTIIGMGKFGGRELNFSSDLDVLMVYSAEGESTHGLRNAEYFAKLGLELINRFKDTGSGTIYEIDLRLRPYGTGGALALPLDGYKSYYNEHADTWERQALIRARPVAGDDCLGKRFLEVAHTFAYSRPLTQDEVADIIHTRQRKETQATRLITTKRRRRRKKTQDVKSGYGGLVDIEFAVQTLQLIHGTQYPSVRLQNTLDAIAQLTEIGVITASDKEHLVRDYEFLRRVENSLRIVHDRPLDSLPDQAAELDKLAKRVGYSDEAQSATEQFLKDYREFTEDTRGLFNRLLNS
ncbi:MAG: hypothetical protein OXI86_02825 [Candidatus Poribacteria bacterium]|nr:hypothetical protein [Candidatus Poribacteria bacterium]